MVLITIILFNVTKVPNILCMNNYVMYIKLKYTKQYFTKI